MQPTIEFTNFHELGIILKEMKEVTQEQRIIIEVQAEEIKRMKKSIKKNAKKTERVNITLYQLLGGLFDHEKQSNILKFSIHTLDGNPSIDDGIDDPSYWGVWPTTRQGDDNEKRIKELEKTLYKISQVFTEDEE